MNKEKILQYIGIVFIASVACIELLSPSKSQGNVPDKQIIIESEYAADFSDDKVLVGASHDIFIGKVIQQVGTKERGVGPETQFEVEVIDNIKGNLSGGVVVDQQGGYKDGKLYIVGDDVQTLSKDISRYLLQPGSTYLFATRFNKGQNWYTLNPYPSASKLISNDSTLGEGQLKVLASDDKRVNELRDAYPKEILLDADIEHNNILNNYASIKSIQNSFSTIDMPMEASSSIITNIPVEATTSNTTTTEIETQPVTEIGTSTE